MPPSLPRRLLAARPPRSVRGARPDPGGPPPPLRRGHQARPGNPGTAERGLPFEWGALEEGGPRNGVMTAIEDFMSEQDGLRLAVIPIFFGCGLLWPESAPWSAPWPRSSSPGTATRSSSGSRRRGSPSSCSATPASRRSTSDSSAAASWSARSAARSIPAPSRSRRGSPPSAGADGRRSRGRS